MTEKRNISQVVRQKLCNTCGSCSVICQAGAIEYQETVAGYCFPVVDSRACTDCGLCLSVCPGIHFGQTLMNRMPDDPFAGDVLEAFVGKATDKRIYENSQSGGIVSALLVHLLESGAADAAVTVVMDRGTPPRPKGFLARSADEIISAQKSKYCPVPLLSVLNGKVGLNQSIVFVGTPCQIHGLLNLADKLPKLKARIALIIGLVCDRVMTYGALDFLLYRAGVLDRSKTLLKYRDKSCGGYPGNVRIQAADGQDIVMPAMARMRIKELFTPVRCRICFDKMNVFSDIVVGDPHGITDTDRNMGESIAVLRTSRGQTFFRQALRHNLFSARKISYPDILAGQKINAKRKEFRGYAEAWQELGYDLPSYFSEVVQSARGGEPGAYSDKLKYSLAIDEYSAREALFRFTDRLLLKQYIRRIFSWPFRAFRKWFRKQHEPKL